MSEISYASAFFLGAFFECVLFGVFFAFLVAACYVQWSRLARGRKLNPVMAFATVFFGLTIIINWIFAVILALRAILENAPGETIEQALSPPYPAIQLIRWGVLQIQIVVAEAIMVYRMYYIYGRNRFAFMLCIVPALCVLTLLGICLWSIIMRDLVRDPTAPISIKQEFILSNVSFPINLFTSFFTTVAISIRLWRVHQDSASANIQVRGSVVLRTMKALVGSASLLTLFITINFIAGRAGGNLALAFASMTGPIVGITFCLIIVRLGYASTETSDGACRVSFRPPTSQAHVSASDQDALPFPQVKVQREVYTSETEGIPMGSLKSEKEDV